MRRTPLLVALASLACLAVGLAILPHLVPAQSARSEPQRKAALDAGPSRLPMSENSARLPIAKVVLFTSGVGYFQREGQVEGDTRIDLSFPVGDVNDLLKSLVLRDLGGGQIRAVGYDSHDPLEKTLKSFAIDLSGNPTLAEILNQARGEKVAVTWQPAGQVRTNSLSGTVLGVEKQKQPVNKEAVVEVEILNVWSDEGARGIKLADVTQVRFQKEALNNEMNRALEVVARGHDRQKKTVSFQFSGKGKRGVQVGYIAEHPVWRTSYRLVLDAQSKPLLQGWAMVENPTSEDWNHVNVSLVSGRPVSFRMDLYQPLYVDRPLVELPTFAGLRPRTYEGEMVKAMPSEQARRWEAKKEAFDRAARPLVPGAAAPTRPRSDAGFALTDLQQSAPTVAVGMKLGEQFQYVIEQPVTLPRQKSALLPIVNRAIEGTRASIYNEQNLAKHPMLGLKLKNTSDLHLMQGPVTVFDEGGYAGDALLDNLQPGEERLLSYAVDLAVEVKTEAKKKPDPQFRLKIVRGIIHKTYTLRDTKTYTIKNRAAQDRLVILEHPVRAPEFTLVTKDEPQKTASYYRFELKVPPGKTESKEVVEEKKVVETVALTNADTQALLVLLQGAALTPEVKAALEKAVDLKNKLAKTQQQIEDLKEKINVINQEQARQRENMKVIPQTEPVYKKYLDKFLKQEEDIDRLRGQIEKLQEVAMQQRQAYEDFVTELTIKEE